ncbi:MAG: DoxX family protein [Chitinophagaceae bacterium]|nr:DoxX family protein [Chitinophagaceae bacterium]
MKENKTLNIILTIIRVFVGLLFIFSGLIKANDPSGLAYKMGEFFEVWAREGYLPSLMLWLNQYAMLFSILMITFEIVAGVALIIGYRFKLFSYLIFLLTVFFTFLTAYALFSGNIKECGCFGDCIKLQANESFMKDLVLLVLIFILMIFRKRIAQTFSNMTATLVIVFSFVISVWMQWYMLKHLPYKDCLAYRVGNNLLKEMTPGPDYKQAEYKTILIYEKDGVKKEFTDKNFPWQDTTWKFVDSKSTVVKEAQNEPPIKDFAISNYDGQDITQTLLSYKGNLFLLFVKDVNEAHKDNIEALQSLISECKKANIPVIGLSASNDIETNKFRTENKLDIEFTTIDATVCKTAMRSNPGLMLLKNGTVTGKWSYADYPAISSLKLDLNDNQISLFPASSVPAEDTVGSPQ